MRVLEADNVSCTVLRDATTAKREYAYVVNVRASWGEWDVFYLSLSDVDWVVEQMKIRTKDNILHILDDPSFEALPIRRCDNSVVASFYCAGYKQVLAADN